MTNNLILGVKRLSYLTVLFFFALFGVYYGVSSTVSKNHFDDIDGVPRNNVGVVLGTSKYVKGGGVNAYFANRIEAAVKLFEEGKVEFLLVSGDHHSDKYYNEPAMMKAALMERGVPEHKIFADEGGLGTFESVLRSSTVFGQNKVTIISQQFQNERALFIADRLGIEAVAYNAEDVGIVGNLKVNVREIFARVKMLRDVYLAPTPEVYLAHHN